MPVFVYRCEKCQIIEELLLESKNYRPEIVCRNCGNKAKRLFTSFGILGLDWNYQTRGYHPERDDAPNEIRYDLKKLEEKAMITTNLKKHRELKRALKNFEFAHRDIL